MDTSFGKCEAIPQGIRNFSDGRVPDKEFYVSPIDDPEHVLCDDDAAAFDGSGYHARLCTGPEFGCIKWQAKKESEPQGVS